MSENQKGVHELLRELKDQLDRVAAQSSEKRTRLENLIANIEGRLNSHINEDYQQELVDEISEEVVEFEADHPTAAATIRSIINMLSSLGL
jgi:hypothetical protein